MTDLCYVPPYGDPAAAGSFMHYYSDDGVGTMRDGRIRITRNPEEAERANWLCVFDTMYGDIPTRVPRERRMLFMMEPRDIRRYPASYVDQFGTVVSPYRLAFYRGRLVQGNPSLGWFVGTAPDGQGNRLFNTFADARNYPVPEKWRRISIVSSLKHSARGHKKRMAFLMALMNRYGREMDYYGRDFAPLEEKMDAIAPYKYHIAVENSQMENYWTEKLSDPWIGWSLPIYWGDPSIAERLPSPRGIERIDIGDIPSAIRTIDRILEEDIYAERLDAIAACREWVLHEANPYERICGMIETSDTDMRGAAMLDRPFTLQRAGNARTLSDRIYQACSYFQGKSLQRQALETYRKIADPEPDKPGGGGR